MDQHIFVANSIVLLSKSLHIKLQKVNFDSPKQI